MMMMIMLSYHEIERDGDINAASKDDKQKKILTMLAGKMKK